MASDDFTDTDGTQIDAHNANWLIGSGSQALSNATIQSNELEIAAFRDVKIFFSGSSEDLSVITLRGGANQGGPAVRMSGSQEGYSLIFTTASGGNWTRLELQKNGSFLAQVTGLTNAQADDWTLKITAAANGSDVDLEGFIDDVSTLTHTDTSSPLTGGEDALNMGNNSSNPEQNDDWFSVVAAGVTLPIIAGGGGIAGDGGIAGIGGIAS